MAADRTLWPHAFGLRTPAPLWTAPAFDRCLLLALLYPILTMSVIWAASGHVGPAEHALGLSAGLSVWQRPAGIGLVWFPAFAIWCAISPKGQIGPSIMASRFYWHRPARFCSQTFLAPLPWLSPSVPHAPFAVPLTLLPGEATYTSLPPVLHVLPVLVRSLALAVLLSALLL